MALRRQLYDQYRLTRAFLRSGAGAGTLLFAAALLASLCANSPLAPTYEHFLHLPVGVNVGGFHLEESLAHWINDGLMAIFFLMVGLEIKREMLSGELSSVRLALLPTIAALGGMVAPALIFAAANHADPLAMRAWAVPVATDIAFSLGVLALLGSRVPLTVKVFLTAVAVIDDLLAIVIIAVFYSGELAYAPLGLAAGLFVGMLALNRLGITSRLPYLLLGALLWLCMLKSGVHATLAGVLTALTIPHGTDPSARDTPLLKLEHALHNPVTYLVLPLFAFANAGVSLVGIDIGEMFAGALPLGITLGLVLGKPVGICGGVWLAVRAGICTMPRQTDWHLLFGVALLCGIGFTVSLFIGNLAFAGVADATALANLVKAGVLTGSLLAGLCGFLYLRHVLAQRAPERA